LTLYFKLLDDIFKASKEAILSISSFHKNQYLKSSHIGTTLELTFDDNSKPIYKPVFEAEEEKPKSTPKPDLELVSLLEVMPSNIMNAVLDEQMRSRLPVVELALDLVSVIIIRSNIIRVGIQLFGLMEFQNRILPPFQNFEI
jgi:hypothetical protein